MPENKPGTNIKSNELIEMLDLLMQHGDLPPLCIWGNHGIGKTEIVQQYALDRAIDFQYLAPAQFEELGDLIGMPMLHNQESKLAPPAWTPKSKKPGILLLDDFNRADDRILRGLMPLLQGFGMVSWSLPPSWRIVCTANPDTGDYSITPLDPAIQTRLMHVQLRFDADNWSAWAETQQITDQQVRFVKSRDTDFFQKRTTARTISQFFIGLNRIKEQELSLAKIKILGDAFLDSESTDEYIDFLDISKSSWVEPSDFLISTKDSSVLLAVLKLVDKPGRIRQLFIDELLTLISSNKPLPGSAKSNLSALLSAKSEEPAFRLMLGRELALIQKESVQGWLADPSFSKLLF